MKDILNGLTSAEFLKLYSRANKFLTLPVNFNKINLAVRLPQMHLKVVSGSTTQNIISTWQFKNGLFESWLKND